MLRKFFASPAVDNTELDSFADDFVKIRKNNREKSRKMNVQIHQCILTLIANVEHHGAEAELVCINAAYRKQHT